MTFEANLSLLMDRFPKLALLAPTWPMAQSFPEPLDSMDLGKIEALYIYGLGQGAPYFQLRSWLQEDKDRRLIFLEDDPSQIAAWLLRKEAFEPLNHPQVHIELLSSLCDLSLLAETFPLKRIEVVALPSRNKTSRFRRLRLHLLRKTTLSHALYLDRLHGYQPMQNFVRNVRHLPTSFYANRLQGAFAKIPAIVCGAGPSLQQVLPLLAQCHQRALLIAGGSTVAALSTQGVLPHFGMAIDPNLEEFCRFKNSFAFEMPLLYSTRVFPSIFQTCNGPFGYMRSGIGGAPELWMEEELGLTDPLIGDHLCSESISVTAICTAWAQFLGCNPILFCGVDLAYTDNRRYAAGVMPEEKTSFAQLYRGIEKEKSAADRILRRKNQEGAWVRTAVRWVMESASLSHFAAKHKEIAFVNTTAKGLGIKGVPYIPLCDAVDRYLMRTYDLYGQVQKEVAKASMPSNTKAIVEAKMGELRRSLDQVVGHLEILAGQRSGSSPLAELELQEEVALQVLFYDIRGVLSKLSPSSEAIWPRFLDLALKYKMVLLRGFAP